MELKEAILKYFGEGRPRAEGRRRPNIRPFSLGWEAAQGGNRRINPYHDDRTHENKVTFARARRKAWFKGYDAYLTEHGKTAITLTDRIEVVMNSPIKQWSDALNAFIGEKTKDQQYSRESLGAWVTEFLQKHPAENGLKSPEVK